jgi:hypothetical protein
MHSPKLLATLLQEGLAPLLAALPDARARQPAKRQLRRVELTQQQDAQQSELPPEAKSQNLAEALQAL